jgi:signal transduction histidine kinase/DNA-binding response OmpR family regulator
MASDDRTGSADELGRLRAEIARLSTDLGASQQREAALHDQQTATASILRVVASGPADPTDVLQNVVDSAARLCVADNVGIWRVDGAEVVRVVNSNRGPGSLEIGTRRPITPDSWYGRAIRERRTILHDDFDATVDTEYPDQARVYRQFQAERSIHRIRSLLVVPLLREADVIGSLSVVRFTLRPFTDAEIALLEAFADHAVIAIENARLFSELQESNRQVTEALEQQTATAEVLRVIASSPTDLDQVLVTLVDTARRLCGAQLAAVHQPEGDHLRPLASARDPAERFDHSAPPMSNQLSLIGRQAVSGRAFLEGQTVYVPNILDVADEFSESIVSARLRGWQSSVAAPLLRGDEPIGVLSLYSADPDAFSPEQIALLESFADQAVIAIENARLFQELQDANQQLAEASQHKSQFLANMSHELRTPLNAVIGYSEMLQEELEDLDQAALVPDVEKINAAGRHLLGLINDILDLSKIEAGKMELFLEPVDLAGLVRDVTTTVSPLIAKNGNALQIDLAPDLGVMQADATRLRQILFNLLGNAAKFTDCGTITLRVAKAPLTPALSQREREHVPQHPEPNTQHPAVAFAVSDTGIGMTEAQLSRLFQAFSQAEASTTRRFGGTGLGLALVGHFCEMMGGTVAVTSAPGVGSTFTVTLPTEAARSEPRVASDDEPLAAHDSLPETRPVVLVVDDDAAARDILRRHLEAEGVKVVGAASGEEGLRLARQLQPALITLDVLMPGMDGWAVLGALKGDPLTADIPVVVLTLLENSDLGYALGAADYLTKPIDRERLVAALRKHVRCGKNRRALVLEDDPATREMLRRMLQREGWTVDEAANGRIGLERVARAAPDLILLDLMMPELDGFGFAERLRAEPAWRTIPVLVVTAKDLTPEERLKLNGWVEQVLQKGAYSRDELLAEVRTLVRASVEQHDDRSPEQ